MLSDWLANLQLLAGRAGRAQPWWDASATTGEGGSACGVAAMGVPLVGSDHPARVHPGPVKTRARAEAKCREYAGEAKADPGGKRWKALAAVKKDAYCNPITATEPPQ